MNTPTSKNLDHTSLSLPRILLGLEGLAVFGGSIALYAMLRGEAWLFLVLILVPDVTMIGYLFNKRVGALLYNIGHLYALPVAMGLLALAASWQTGLLLALIWAAHIGMDRMFGYGMKYETAFQDTHLQRI